MIKKILTVALSATIVASSVITGNNKYVIECDKCQSDAILNDGKNQYDLQATNSLGKFIAQSSKDNNPGIKSLSNRKDDTFSVTNLGFDVESGIIVATSTQTQNSTIFFSFIDENTNKIVQEVKKSVLAGEYISTESKVDTAVLPQFFIVQAELVDSKGNTISNVFKLNTYTHIIQDIAATDIHDFNEEQVINFDESEETNFIVLSDDTIRAESSDEENTLVSADYDSNTFVFENVNETIKYLQGGDLLYIQPDAENIIAIEVDDIIVDGDTATIMGNDDIEEMFDFIKIESETNNENITVNTAPTDDLIMFPGHENEKEFTLDNNEPLYFTNTPKSLFGLPFAIGFEYEKKKTLTIDNPGCDWVNGEDLYETGGAGLVGSVEFSTKLNFYLKDDYISYGLLFTPKIQFKISFKTKDETFSHDFITGEEPINLKPVLAELKIPTCIPGLNMIVNPQIIIRFRGELAVVFTFAPEFGFKGDSDTFNYISEFGPDKSKFGDIEVKGEIFIGLHLDPGFAIYSKDTLSVSLDITAGLVISIEGEVSLSKILASKGAISSENGKVSIVNMEDDEYHSCYFCLDIGFALTVQFGYTVKALKHDYSKDIGNEIRIPLPDLDAYCSVPKENGPIDFGWRRAYGLYETKKTCPYRKYRAEFSITDADNGKPVQGLEIVLEGLSQYTDEEGKAAFFCDPGSYSYEIKFEGEKIKSDLFNIRDSKKAIYERLKITKGSDGNTDISPKDRDIENGERYTTAATTKPPTTTSTTVNILPKEEHQIGEAQQLGENIWGLLYRDGYMLIYGYGDMYDNKSLKYSNSENIIDVVFKDYPSEGKYITSIGNNLFEGAKNLESITYEGSPNKGKKSFDLPDTIVSIGNNAFKGCGNLEFGDIMFSDKLEKIGNDAFENCLGITAIIVPGSVKEIGLKAFMGCTKLTQAVFKEGIEDIGWGTLAGCEALEELTMPYAGLNLEAVESETRAIDSNGGMISRITSIFSLDKYSDRFSYSDKLKKVTITGGTRIPPQTLDFGTDDGGWAPLPNPITTIILPDSITCIEKNAFSNCTNLETINLPSSVEYIGDRVFSTIYEHYRCEKMTISNSELPSSLKYIGKSAFQGCTSLIEELIVPGSVETIGEDAFNGCSSIKKAVFKDGVGSIGKGALANCSSLEELTLPYAGTSLDAVENNNSRISTIFTDTQKNVTSEINVKKIAFTGGSTIPNNALSKMSKVTEVILPSSIKTIGNYSFNDCIGLTYIYFYDTLKYVGIDAFTKCTAIEEVGYSGSDEQWNNIVIENDNTPIKRNIKYNVPDPYKTEEHIYGDTNGDGQIDMSDAVMIMQALANPNKYGINGTDPKHISAEGFKYGDADGNGLTVNDALRIQQYLLGHIDSL